MFKNLEPYTHIAFRFLKLFSEQTVIISVKRKAREWFNTATTWPQALSHLAAHGRESLVQLQVLLCQGHAHEGNKHVHVAPRKGSREVG